MRYKALTSSTGISYDLPGYTFSDQKIYVEKISVNSEKASNVEKLEQIAELEDGWDGDGAGAFSAALIQTVRDIVVSLDRQPEIFPTACDTIQMEYDHEDGSYLEIEISDDNRAKVFSVDCNGEERLSFVEACPYAICEVVSSFYG